MVAVVRDVPVLTSSFLPKLGREECGHDFQIRHKPGVPKGWEIVCGLDLFSSQSAFLWQQELRSSDFLGDSPVWNSSHHLCANTSLFSVASETECTLCGLNANVAKAPLKAGCARYCPRCLLRVWAAAAAVSHLGSCVWMWSAQMTGEGVPLLPAENQVCSQDLLLP